jgi:16S rRNA (guanine527-N7)-methyltransferase
VTGEEERARDLLSKSVEGGLVEPLARYAALVLEANAKFNLTGARDAGQFIEHIQDSLTVVPYVRSPHIDIGSGAGLPGIPVALATRAAMVLIEATGKKAAFLREASEALGLGAIVEVISARAEDAGRDSALREHFGSATIRAVASAPAAIELAAPFLAVGGVAILQRGPADEAYPAALGSAAKTVGCTVESEVASSGGRRLILVRKTEPISESFPRRAGIARKRPLA